MISGELQNNLNNQLFILLLVYHRQLYYNKLFYKIACFLITSHFKYNNNRICYLGKTNRNGAQ